MTKLTTLTTPTPRHASASTASASRGFLSSVLSGASFGIAFVCLAGGLIAGASLAPAPSVVASVDLSRVFNESNLNANNGMRLKAMSDSLAARVADAEKKVKDKQAELELYGPNSTRWAQAQTELFTLIGEYRAEQAFASGKLDTETSRTINDTYNQVKDEVASFAKAASIDYVFVNDSIPKLVPADPQKMMGQIAQRGLLYANGTLDITEAVLTAINKTYPLAPGAKSPPTGGAAAPAAGQPAPSASAAPAAGSPAGSPTGSPTGSKS
jgi:Skp family chaperone for outer membrane proteins